MGSQTINTGDLTLTVPTSGTRNWAASLISGAWNKISEHDHTGPGKGDQIGTAALVDDSITTAKLSPNFGVTVATTLVPAGTTQAIDLNNGMIQILDLGAASGNVAVTLSNPEQGGVYKIFIIQAAVAKSITWPASVKWPQSQSPILTSTDNAVDSVTLVYISGSYYADWQLNYG